MEISSNSSLMDMILVQASIAVAKFLQATGKMNLKHLHIFRVNVQQRIQTLLSLTLIKVLLQTIFTMHLRVKMVENTQLK